MLANILTNAKRLTKLNKAISLHRLLVIFLQSNPAPFVAIPCLDILASCLATPGLDSFQRQFEAEGGFALLAKTLAPIWNAHIQEIVFEMLFGPTGPAAASLACPPAIASIMAALDTLLQSASGVSASNDMAGSIGSIGSLKSLSFTPMRSAHKDDSDSDSDGTEVDDDDRLENLLNTFTQVYRQSSPLRRALTARRIETMLPAMVDFVTMSGSSSERAAAVGWLQALIDLSKAPPTILTQLKLLVEQLRSSSSADSTGRTPTSMSGSITRPGVARRRSSNLSTSMGRLSTSASTVSSPITSSPIRSRPSAEAGPIARLRAGVPTRVPLRRTLTGESILQEEKDKNSAWRMIILSTVSWTRG